MSGRAGFSDDFHQRVLFNLFNSSLNEDHVLDTSASSQHGGGIKLKRKATPSGDNNYMLKSRKRRSKVWNDFRLDIKSDGKKAICDHCNKEFIGESKKGTSHLFNHLKVCPEKRRRVGGGNKPSGNENLTAHVVTVEKSTADLELSSLDLTRPAIKRGWETFTDDLLHVYKDEKQKLCKSFIKLSGRFSLAVDEYDSSPFRVYYIDENWEMKRYIWCRERRRTGDFITEFETSPFGSHIELRSIVWRNNDDRDKCKKLWRDIPGRETYVDHFKDFVSLEGYIDYVSGGKGVGSVSDIIKNMLEYDLFEKVDKAFTYVKSVLYENDKHDLLTEIRVDLTEKEGDMTYFRTVTCVLEYKEAFLELERIDCTFKSLSLRKEDWEILTAAYDCLKVLNDVTCSLYRNKYKTANSCIHLIHKMYETLRQLGTNDSNHNSYTQKIASRMADNFVEDYWKGNSLVLSIAAVLDPHFKMEFVRKWYNIMQVEVHIGKFISELRCIYNCYANVPDNPELDDYLAEKPSDLPTEDWEILAWWRNSAPRFPTLAKIARDFLAVPICEVNSHTKDDIMKMNYEISFDEKLAFEWAKFWLQYSPHEVQILENTPSYHGQEITQTRQGNASSNCEMGSHTVRHNTSNTPHPKQTRDWSKVWNDCTLTPSSYERHCSCFSFYGSPKNWTAEERQVHYSVCPAQRFFKEENLGPFRRSDLTTLVNTKKKFKVDCELDGLDLARMTLKLGYTAFVDNLLHVYKEEKQKAAKYLNELSCRISLEVGNFDIGAPGSKIIRVQFIDEVWKLQRKILCLDLKGNGDCIGISPQELKAGRNLCSIVHVDALEEIDDEGISPTKHPFHDLFFLPFSGNFQGIQSLSCYIYEFIAGGGAESVSHKMKNILGCDIFYKIHDCYWYVHEKYNDNFGKNHSTPDNYDHQSWGIALEVRETFLKLEGKDRNFKSINLTDKEWDALIAGCNCLKVFKDVTSEHLSGKEYITANVCLPLICDIFESMQRIGNNNYYIHEIIEHLKETFVKDYWDGNGLALAIAAVLDPRFKMDVVEKWYNLIYGKEAEVHIQGFKEELRRCYNYYGDGSELDHYLRAPKRSIYDDFGILTWWRDSTSQFPTLARMARDILAIPVWSDNSAMIDEIQKISSRFWAFDIDNAFICIPSWLETLKGK